MSCNHPLTAFFTGSFTEKGKPDYVIGKSGDKVFRCSEAEKKGHHVSPSANLVQLNGLPYLKDPVAIPCGHCVGCRMEHAKQWKVRCCLESMSHENTWFVTLTYNNAYLPWTKEGELCLRPSDVTKFFKRFRKVYGKCRYFYCGEYGENTHRPHYHLILFGCDFGDLVQIAPNAFRSKTLEKVWPFGLCTISKAEPNCIAYVAGYCEKKQNDPLWSSYAVKPFTRMSRKPAIGSLALEQLVPGILSSGKVYGDFNAIHYANAPRTFIRKLEDAFPDWFKAYKQNNQINGERSAILEHSIYNTSDVERIGMAKDIAAFEKLTELRRSTL